MTGFATGLSTCITKDGQTTITANLPMGGFRHTGVGNGVARNDYAAAGQVQDSAFIWCGTAGGTKNALTLTPTPVITAYATGQRFIFKSGSSASDDAVTVAISSLTTKAIQLNDAALSSTVVIEASKYYEVLYDGTAFQISRLSSVISRTGADGDVVTGTAGTDGNLAQWNSDGDLVDGPDVLDEDDMASDSATAVPTQQSVKAYVDGSGFQGQLLHARDEKTANTAGGTFTSGDWRTRTIALVTGEISGASVATNQITLPTGIYYIEASAPGHGVDTHVAKLRNISDSTDTLIGTASIASNTGDATQRSFIAGRFTIAAQKIFEIQHQCLTTRTTNGFGNPCNFGVVEVYTDVRIWKVG